ncbi:MAG TPA: hypothetical protein VJQ56_07050 [Blastocatellia bacterium]|nr:hypothetical protein [Blastocatellia bacterium]
MIGVSLAVGLAFSEGATGYGQTGAATKPTQQVQEFEDRVKQYVKMREQLEEKLPKLSKEAKPEQIEAHKNTFQEMVRSARAGARQGTVFTPGIASHIRAIIKREFKGKDLKDLRNTVLEAENKGVPLRVNYPYPVTKELVEMPPTLLLALPQLPKQMRYRFVGRNMLLVDRENGLIIDYMVNALP